MKHSIVFFVALTLLNASAFAEKLKVDLYVEALCPYCQRYILGQLSPLFKNGLADAMDLSIYYCGNAKLIEGELNCQHGRGECYLNKILDCGIVRAGGAAAAFPFIECVEQNAYKATKDKTVIKHCAALVDLDFDDIQACAVGEEGDALQMAAYRATKGLKPVPRGVPWIIVNDMPAYGLAYVLDKLLCMNTPKEDRPDECYEEGDTDLVNKLYDATCKADPEQTQLII